MYFIECNFLPLNPIGGIAKLQGNDLDEVDTIILPSHSKNSLEPFQKCIDECKKHDNCNSFTYCPSSSQSNPNSPSCRLKDAKFTGDRDSDLEATEMNEWGCLTIFKKCDEGNFDFKTQYTKVYINIKKYLFIITL